MLSPLASKQRAPRVRLVDITPAVLRFPDGHRTSGELQVLSVNGGLLSLSGPLVPGSQVKVMFLTGAGPVLSGAEMLPPVSPTQQPFRFVSLPTQDRRRLGTVIEEWLEQNTAEPEWMKKLRAASGDPTSPHKRFAKALGRVGFIVLCLAGAFYLLQIQPLQWIGR